jgi:hypothetical protein
MSTSSLPPIGDRKPAVHRPLDDETSEIRLLELHPGEGPDVRCSLHHCRIDDASTSYEALSYAWGDQRDKVTISIGDDHLEITVDLATALRKLRNRQASRLLWIDQISINQGDTAERNAQVNLMHDIYESATRVIVWLGEEDALSGTAMSFIEENEETVTSYTDEDHPDELHQIFNDPTNKTGLEAIVQAILQNAYFERYWIIQEIILASDVIVCIGSRSISWKTLLKFVDGISTYNHTLIDTSKFQISSTIFVPSLLDYLRDCRHQEPMQLFDPWDVIQKFRLFKATVPSDRIYSWLGICDLWRQAGFTIDYSRHEHDTFKLFTRAMMEHDQNLRWLSLAGSPRTLATLPSWVADLELPRSLKPPDKLAYKGSTYSADRGAAVGFHFSSDTTSLFCNGVIIDTVSFLTRAGKDLLSICFGGRLDPSTPPELVQATGLRYGEALKFELEGLLTARRMPGWEESGLDDNRVSVVSLFRLMHRINQVRPGLAGDINSIRLVYKSTLGRRAAFVSGTGYVGLVPEYAQVGDVVCVLFGSKVPVVLRKNADHYGFVGDWLVTLLSWSALTVISYAAGIMDGEYAELVDQGQTRVEQFELR